MGADQEPAGRSTSTTADLVGVDRRLREILAPLRSRLVATKDGAGGLTLEIPGLEGQPWGYVAGTRVGKRYVSFYLMSLYASPALKASISPELQRRMQGKSCFNFTKVDEGLFAELEQLAKETIEPHIALAKQVAAGKPRARSR